MHSQVVAQRSLWSRWTLKWRKGPFSQAPWFGLNCSTKGPTWNSYLLQSKRKSGDKSHCELDSSWLGVLDIKSHPRSGSQQIPSPKGPISRRECLSSFPRLCYSSQELVVDPYSKKQQQKGLDWCLTCLGSFLNSLTFHLLLWDQGGFVS